MPVSLTEISTEPSASLAFIPILPPSGVNFTALERRLRRICLILRSSPTKSPRSSSTDKSSVIECRTARSRTNVRAFSNAVGRSNVLSSSSIRPASTLERSRISLIRDRRWRPEERMSSVYSACFSFSSPNSLSPKTSEKPMMALSGVRSSCDMLARNSDLCRLAASIWRLLSSISRNSRAF